MSELKWTYGKPSETLNDYEKKYKTTKRGYVSKITSTVNIPQITINININENGNPEEIIAQISNAIDQVSKSKLSDKSANLKYGFTGSTVNTVCFIPNPENPPAQQYKYKCNTAVFKISIL